jgi:hypothetical protein
LQRRPRPKLGCEAEEEEEEKKNYHENESACVINVSLLKSVTL